MAWFVFTKRDQLDAGTGSYALANYRMPINSLFGMATPAGCYQSHSIAPQIQYWQGAPVTGLGGIQQGQLVGQPLLDPNVSSFDPASYITTGDAYPGV